jgi:cysteine-rich repeat protein
MLCMRTLPAAFVFIVSLGALGREPEARAAVHLVPSEYSTIQAGVDAASSGDSVFVAPGVYPEAVVIAGKYLYLSGAASDSVTIDGQGLDAPCLTIDGPAGGQTVVRGFTFYRADNADGAVLITNAASALIEACCVAFNRATGFERGAVSVSAGAAVDIRGCRIVGNMGVHCGGIAALGSTVELTGNLIAGNRADAFTGGCYLRNCATEMRHNTILDNQSMPGGSLVGAVYTDDGVAITMIDNVVVFNSGHGVTMRDPISYQVEYNDVYGNESGDYQTINWSVDLGSSPTNISAVPELLPPEYLPQAGSPVAGSGSDGGNMGLDSAVAPCSPDAAAPVCGNDVLEVGEQCDDGNNEPGDGCSSTCFKECPIVLTGDVNLSGSIDAADIIYLVNFIFKGASAPQPCKAAGDVNCSGTVTSADVIVLIGYIFKGGAPPCDGCTSPLVASC